MVKKIVILLLVGGIFTPSLQCETLDAQLLPLLVEQVKKKAAILDTQFPEYTQNGRWVTRTQPNWLSGFLAGELWLLYDLTGDEDLKQKALMLSDRLLAWSQMDNTHDMGFIFLPSCVRAYQHTGEEKYKLAALQAANMLWQRFNPQGQYIRAWGRLGTEDRAGLMIIDTMMNLELLFWAYQVTHDYRFYDVAYRHALTTWRESVRADGSSYHVVEFDPETGKVVRKFTHQGAADESTWARGQAWGIYGFAKAYQYTKDQRFLKTSAAMADYFIRHLPADWIPYWDLNLGTGQERDASAAAIAICGLYELGASVSTLNETEYYLGVARQIYQEMVAHYLFPQSTRPEEGILLHTVYHRHKNWGIDESFPAGDYYCLLAIHKWWQAEQQSHLIKPIHSRQIINLNREWYYLEDDAPDLARVLRTDKDWQKVDLPHTWNAFDAVDNIPGYRRGISWYRKKIKVPRLEPDQRVALQFEGVNISCDVYCNSHYAGGHIGGYVGFEVDLTPYLRPDTTNNIWVKVDNSYNSEIIPSQKSDFVIFGGITRDVWLKVLPPIAITRVQVRTPIVNARQAQTQMSITLANGRAQNIPIDIEATLLDPQGKPVSSMRQKEQLKNGTTTLTINLPAIANPRLWSPDEPNLYQAQVVIRTKGQIYDQVTERYGYRWFEFKEKGAFFLNGKRLLLRGTHRHEDWAGYGNALPDSLHRQDMVLIKRLGANFVRLAHYPQDPEVYRACDELGILVWDELPWCRGGMGGPAWRANTKRLLHEMITQNYNHPAIIIWSLGNELDWLPDSVGGDDPQALNTFLKELNDLAHSLDPERLTAIRKFTEGAPIVDLFSPSIWSGWYSGVYKSYQNVLEEARQRYRRFFHAEYGGDSHYGRHGENPITGDGLIVPDQYEENVNQVKVKNVTQFGDWSESYIVDLFDWYLQVSENLPWLSGNAQWALKDFPTPLRPENPIPYINQKGLLTRDGRPKDAYYVFQSYWTTQPQFCYIESPTWTERYGLLGQSRTVCVFSNCPEVELLLNDISLGKRRRDTTQYPACGLHWEVNFQEGTNRLLAVGYDGYATCRDSLVVNYSTQKSGSPEQVQLSARRLANGHFLIEALVVDGKGRRCLDYNRRIYFSAMGSGHLLVDYGTPTGSQIIEAANGYAAIEFVPVPGEAAVIEVRNQDFKGSYLRLNP